MADTAEAKGPASTLARLLTELEFAPEVGLLAGGFQVCLFEPGGWGKMKKMKGKMKKIGFLHFFCCETHLNARNKQKERERERERDIRELRDQRIDCLFLAFKCVSIELQDFFLVVFSYNQFCEPF
jgi:hypothetical protein